MRALCWRGKKDVAVERVPDPKLLTTRDAIVRITSTAICGSDLHLYDGFIPTMKAGDILGHEFMGEVVETGRDVTNLKAGDRVVVPFTIACGSCFFCKKQFYSAVRQLQPERGDRPRRCTATRRAPCLATRTCSAATPVGRPSSPACRSPMSARCKVPDHI